MPKSRPSIQQQFLDALLNDEVVKFIFDHLRNVGIAGLVVAASQWRIRSAKDTFHIVDGWVLMVVGVLLLLMLAYNFTWKLARLDVSTLVKLVVAFFYITVFLSLLAFFIASHT